MKVNLGMWNNIFSVPTDIVDEHLATCEGIQLKVLLYLLRYPGKNIDVEEISNKLSVSCAAVYKAVDYWVSNGIVLGDVDNSQISYNMPCSNFELQTINKNNLYSVEQASNNITTYKSPVIEKLQDLENAARNKKTFKPITIAPRLTIKEALERISNDENLKFLIKETPKILKRNITSIDTIIIVSFIDWTGISVDLVLMLMNYCALINKRSAKSIEKEAYNWVNYGIDTHEKAENFIRENLELIKVQQDVMYATHKKFLTEREKAFVKKWVLDFGFDIKMIKLAYERALTRKGEKDFSYINGILTSWFKKGITKPEEVDDENNIKSVKENTILPKNKSVGIFQFKSSDSFSVDDLKAKVEN